MKRVHLLVVLGVTLICAATSACGGGGTDPQTPTPDPVTLSVTAILPEKVVAGGVVSLTGTLFEAPMTVDFGGTPASATVTGSESATVVVPPVAAGPIVVRVTTAAGTTDPWVYTVGTGIRVFPDECADARVMPQVPCIETLAAQAATGSPTDPLLSCTTSPAVPRRGDATVWYAFTATSTEMLQLTTDGSDYDTVLAVFTGDCQNLVEVACDDNGGTGAQSRLTWTAMAGTTYTFEVAAATDGANNPAPAGNLVISLTRAPVLIPAGAGDECVLPNPMADLPYRATADTTTHTANASDPSMSCVGPVGDRSIWFSYTAPSDQVLVVDTFGSDYDTVVAIYDGGCGALNELGCDDDAQGSTQSSVAVELTAAQQVLVLVTTFNAPRAGGTLQLHAQAGVTGATSSTRFADLVATELASPQVFGSGLAQTVALTSDLTNLGTTPAPGGAFGDGLGTFRLRGAGQGPVIVEGDKGPIFLTNNGGCILAVRTSTPRSRPAPR